jgi:hypothetical protein
MYLSGANSSVLSASVPQITYYLFCAWAPKSIQLMYLQVPACLLDVLAIEIGHLFRAGSQRQDLFELRVCVLEHDLNSTREPGFASERARDA